MITFHACPVFILYGWCEIGGKQINSSHIYINSIQFLPFSCREYAAADVAIVEFPKMNMFAACVVVVLSPIDTVEVDHVLQYESFH